MLKNLEVRKFANKILFRSSSSHCSKKNNYTILIPCAGDGKRLKSDKPKVLFKINGKTLLEILVKKFSRFTAEYCFVVSPKK